VLVAEDGNQVKIQVEDNGIGIAPEFLPYVFDLFSQSQRSLDRTQSGLGIGLTLVKRLIDLHGGKVEAASAGLWRGATFTIYLPKIEPQQTQDICKNMPSAKAGTKRVLIVDDNRDAADALSELLILEGHEAQSVYGALAAIDKAAQICPDAVLLDIGLPQIDGYELARMLHEVPALKNVTLIAVTGYGQARDKESDRARVFDHYLVKPVDLDKLSEILASLPPKGGEPEN